MSSIISKIFSDDRESTTAVNPTVVAQKVRSMLKWHANNEYLLIEDVAEKMGFVVRLEDILPEDAMGVITAAPKLNGVVGNSKCVLINTRLEYNERRVVLAYELGHFLFEFDDKEPGYTHILSSRGVFDENDTVEQQIDEFITELLMPSEQYTNKEIAKESNG